MAAVSGPLSSQAQLTGGTHDGSFLASLAATVQPATGGAMAEADMAVVEL